MEIPPAEVIDRMSIVKLKIERIGNVELEKELTALETAIERFKENGVKIEDSWLNELYNINKEEWDLLEKMNNERIKEECDFEAIGKLYLETEKVNKKRAEVKNIIVEETGEGFKEIKKNHPSS